MGDFLKGISDIIRNISLNPGSGVKPLTPDFDIPLGRSHQVGSKISRPSEIGGVKPANEISPNFNLYIFPIAIGKMYNLKIHSKILVIKSPKKS